MKNPILAERCNLFDMGMVIYMRIEVTGKATSSQLTNAFHTAVASQEILNSKVLLEEDGRAYYINGNGQKQSFTFSGLCIDEIIMQQERTRFRVEDGEFMRAFCYQYSEHGFSILFCMHHLAGDGKSLVYFIESFLYALQGAPLAYQQMELLSSETMPKGSKPPFFYKLYAKKFNKNWKKDKNHHIFTLEDLKHYHQSFWEQNFTRVEEYEIPDETMNRIIKDCKKWDIKLTAYFIALMLKANAKSFRNVGLAVDARNNQNRAMSNQATGISIAYDYDTEKPFATNAKEIQKCLNKKLLNPKYKYFIEHFMTYFDPSLLDALDLESAGFTISDSSLAFSKVMKYTENKIDLSITNLTRLDIPVTYGSYTLSTFVFIPPVIAYGDHIIGLCTHNNRTFITLHVYGETSLTLKDLIPTLLEEE